MAGGGLSFLWVKTDVCEREDGDTLPVKRSCGYGSGATEVTAFSHGIATLYTSTANFTPFRS